MRRRRPSRLTHWHDQSSVPPCETTEYPNRLILVLPLPGPAVPMLQLRRRLVLGLSKQKRLSRVRSSGMMLKNKRDEWLSAMRGHYELAGPSNSARTSLRWHAPTGYFGIMAYDRSDSSTMRTRADVNATNLRKKTLSRKARSHSSGTPPTKATHSSQTWPPRGLYSLTYHRHL